MEIIVDLKPEIKERLDRAAEERNIEPAAFAGKLIEDALPSPLSERQLHLLSMLDEWDAEDQTDDPEVIALRLAEWEEFKQSINQHHGSDRLVYP